MREDIRFQLIHNKTGLSFGQYKSRYPLQYYPAGNNQGDPYTDKDFANQPVRAILRADGAIGFQKLELGWDDCALYFLVRKDWTVHLWRDEA